MVRAGNAIKDTRGDKIFNWAVGLFLAAITIIVLYPLYFTVIASFSDPVYVNNGRVWLLPRGVVFDGYDILFKDNRIWNGYRNTLFYTLAGTSLNLLVTLPAAYSLSRKDFMPRKAIMLIFVFTMYFNSGMIPHYILINNLGLMNTVWAMILPKATAVWNIILARTFFASMIPDEMREAAVIDGCSNTRLFVQIVLPLSKAIIAVMALFFALGHWNSFYDALLYLRDKNIQPLQIYLREVLISQQIGAMLGTIGGGAPDLMAQMQRRLDLMKYSIIIVANLPMLILYPFIQKYFTKGIMLGSLKG